MHKYAKLLLAIKPRFNDVICIQITQECKYTVLNMLLLYTVDITDHEGLLALLLGAADVPQESVQQHPHPKDTETLPAEKEIQMEQGTQRDLPEPEMLPDMPHQERTPAANDVEPATQ